MKLTARVSALLTGLLAAACFYGTFHAWRLAGTAADPNQLRDARGYAGFWAFLGCVFLAIAVLSWRSTRHSDK